MENLPDQFAARPLTEAMEKGKRWIGLTPDEHGASLQK